jgi:hypothetical protein
MATKSVFTRILAIVGTVLVWLPILAPILFTAGFFITRRMFRFDYLMPAELFPVGLTGGVLLLWAAIRAHSQRKLIGGGLAGAVVLLFGGQGLAVVTGLASGATEPSGWLMGIVMGTIAAYSLAMVAVGVGGILLLKKM